MSAVGPRLRLRSIDEYLGPAEQRFFGSGYRRASHQVGDVRVFPATEADQVVTARITIGYPGDWSRKKDEIDVPPHVSSIDALVLGVQLAEAHLAYGYGLGPEQRRTAQLRRITLIAGTAPQEELTDLSAGAWLRGTAPLPEAPGMCVSVYECRIGVMRARYEIIHAAPAGTARPAEFRWLEDALGPAETRYYGAGFALGGQRLADVTADTEGLSAHASVLMEPAKAMPDGIEGSTSPAFSPVDCFVACLQLAQVLMYEMDNIRRSDSNTLWMLRTSLDAARPRVAASPGSPHQVMAKVTGSHLLPLHGRSWRNTEISGESAGIRLRCSLAHELPEKTAATDAAGTP
ncbi:AvrD family protein [Actinacidiphila sp. bgisy145]|uniref:AvrD family protein n=1 Tax=Actinacidiphila sp. bgisy145 TaxID=3413792 RepID=UPI003EBD8060